MTAWNGRAPVAEVLHILVDTLGDSRVPILGPEARALLDPVPSSDVRRAIGDSLPALIAGLDGDERNVILTLSRMWMTAVTGEIRSKDAAADWALARLPPEHSPLVRLARDAYRGDEADDWSGRGAELRALVQHMRAAIEDALRKYATVR